MDINPELQAAVRERVKLGHHQSTILQELREAGYSEAEAEAVYVAVASERTVGKDEVPATASAATAPASHSEPPTAPSSSRSSFFSRHPGLAIASIVLLLGVGGTVAASALFDLSGWRNYVPFLSGAPYDEVTLLPGIITDLSETTTASVDSSFRVAWEPRTAQAKEAFPEMFSSIEALGAFVGGLPDEASAESQVLTQVDARDPDDVRSHIEASVTVDFDIMQLQMAGSLRQIDTTLYGRIDEFPAMMTAELGDVPTNTWIELFDEAALRELESGGTLPSVPGVSWLPLLDRTGISQGRQAEWVTSLRQVLQTVAPESQAALVAMPENMPPTPGSGTTATGLLDDLDEETREEVVDAVANAWIAAPLVRFAESPQRVRENGETVYRYDLDIDAENLTVFLNTLRTELAAYPELVQELPTAAELPDAVLIEQFNTLVDALVTVRTDGSLHGLSVSSVLTSPDPLFENQLNFALNALYAELGADVTITAPTDVHPQTLLEMVEAEQRAAQEAQVKQRIGNLRATAELHYNDNELSYAGLCDRVADRSAFWPEQPQCAAANDAYAVQQSIGDTTAFCVDSTGFRGDVPIANWSTTTPSYTCVSE